MQPLAGTPWSGPGSGCRLAKNIVADMVDDQTLPGWFAGDEVYGRSRELRDYIQAQGAGYVLRAGCDFRVEVNLDVAGADVPRDLA